MGPGPTAQFAGPPIEEVWEEIEPSTTTQAPFSVIPDFEDIVVCDADEGTCQMQKIPPNTDIEEKLPGHCELVWVTLPNGEE